MYYSDKVSIPRTDFSRWRLRTDEIGRETWEYIDESEVLEDKQSTFVQHLLKQADFPSPVNPASRTPFDHAKAGTRFLALLQEDNGVFPCQYKGPMFMAIGYVAACCFTKSPIDEAFRTELIRYIVNVSHPVDGGWGLYEGDKSTCFGTSMNYVVLRLLGLDASHPVCVKARKTLLRLGSAVANPHWGKAWLSTLNLYKWEGVNPAPPELWMLPDWLPMHPGNWWVHTRAIYLPLGYLSAARVQCEDDELLRSIRTEIYSQDYDKIDFSQQRNNVCGIDLYYPHTTALNVANNVLVAYEKWRPQWILAKANKKVYGLIKKELANTDHLGIAPVSAAFNAIVTFVEEGPDSEAFLKVREKLKDVVFMGPQGMTVMGTNGVQVWDTAFALKYLVLTSLGDLEEFQPLIRKGFGFLVKSQFSEECEPGSYRDKRVGAWPFSTKNQGYTVSDCTAEALKAIIMVKKHPAFRDLENAISDEMLFKAIDVLLGLQNLGSFHYGSFSTYEKTRATPLLEKLNPAEVFGNIMVEYPYVECTDSVVLGLTYFRKYYKYKSEQVTLAIDRAISYIEKSQGTDGSWYGCWGVCYTYAGMFALEAFSTVHRDYFNSMAVKKGCDFLVSRQLPDGGWGETMKSCETHTYVSSLESYVVQTAWVVIGLLLAKYPDRNIIERGIKLLMERQLESGEWKFEAVEGVFNHSCGIEYPSYRFLFPIKALGLFKQVYGDDPL